MYTRRPDSVTAVGIIVSVFGLIAILRSLFGFVNVDGPNWGAALNADLVLAGCEVGAIYTFVAGINLLKGAEWARAFFISSCIFNYAYSAFVSVLNLPLMVPGTLIDTVCIACLFLPSATDYFTRRRRPARAPIVPSSAI